jgi:medium-chain acyl-[acyl-carrier-protein] hydrolase
MTLSLRTANHWVFVPRVRPDAQVRLFCFPHAGGTTEMFTSLLKLLHPSIELALVQLPGRASRLREASLTSMRVMVSALTEALDPLFDRPFAFFGHSMGGLIAYELARAIEPGRSELKHLFLSGCPAPQRRTVDRQVRAMNDEQLIRFLAAMEGTPVEVLQNAELLQLLLPLVRADFELVETYQFKPGPHLRSRCSLLFGCRDPETETADAGLWGDLTEAACDVHHFDGNHFFVANEGPRIAALISETLVNRRALTAKEP